MALQAATRLAHPSALLTTSQKGENLKYDNINSQEGHIILKDLSEGRTSIYIFWSGGGEELYSVEHRYLQTVRYTKRSVNDRR